MKKLIAIIFIVTYFVTSSGVIVRLHYCMDKLADWSFSTRAKAICDSCGMEKKGHKGCCHDENRIIKVNKDHKTSTQIFDFLKLTLHPFQNRLFESVQLRAYKIVAAYYSTNSPPTLVVHLYLFNSIFRI